MKVKVRQRVRYPSAELLLQPCMEDYKYQLESYNRIYDKVNIAMAFCTAVLVVILDSVDTKYVPMMLSAVNAEGFLRSAIPFFLSLGSAVLIFVATIQLLNLMISRSLKVFDSVAFRNEHCYFDAPEYTAFLLIAAYTEAAYDLRSIVAEKQSVYDSTIKKALVAIILFALYTALKEVMAI